MSILLYLYGVVSFVLAVTAFLTGSGLYFGFAIIASAFLSFWAGSGLKGSIIAAKVNGNVSAVWGGCVCAFVFFGLASLLAWHSRFVVNILDIAIKGPVWCCIGFVLAWFATSQKDVSLDTIFPDRTSQSPIDGEEQK